MAESHFATTATTTEATNGTSATATTATTTTADAAANAASSGSKQEEELSSPSAVVTAVVSDIFTAAAEAASVVAVSPGAPAATSTADHDYVMHEDYDVNEVIDGSGHEYDFDFEMEYGKYEAPSSTTASSFLSADEHCEDDIEGRQQGEGEVVDGPVSKMASGTAMVCVMVCGVCVCLCFVSTLAGVYALKVARDPSKSLQSRRESYKKEVRHFAQDCSGVLGNAKSYWLRKSSSRRTSRSTGAARSRREKTTIIETAEYNGSVDDDIEQLQQRLASSTRKRAREPCVFVWHNNESQ